MTQLNLNTNDAKYAYILEKSGRPELIANLVFEGFQRKNEPQLRPNPIRMARDLEAFTFEAAYAVSFQNVLAILRSVAGARIKR